MSSCSQQIKIKRIPATVNAENVIGLDAYLGDFLLTTALINSACWDDACELVPIFYANSGNWQEAYNNLVANSADYLEQFDASELQALSSFWNSVYSTTNSGSANWQNAYNNLVANSALYLIDQTVDISELQSASSSWNSVYSTVNIASSIWAIDTNDGDLNVNVFVYSNSADILNIESVVQSNSALWAIDNTIDLGVRSLTSNWEDTYNTVQDYSALWIIDNSIDLGVRSLTSNWQNTYSTVQSNSSTTWNYQGTDLKILSSNWEDTYNTVQDYSALWIIDNSIDLGVRSLTSNWQNTYINFSTQSANNINVYNTVNSNSASWIGGATGDYLPLSGGTITGHLTVTEYLSTPLINLVTTGVTATTVKGDVFWDVNDDTLAIDMGNGVVQQVGFEQYIEIKANGSNIDNGTVVWATDAVSSGNSGIIRGTNNVADGNTPARFLLGVATEDILSGENGRVTTFGVVREVNLGSYADSGETWAVGQVLYPSPTISGGWTNVEPVAPRLAMPIAFILFINNGTTKSNVTMMVRVDSGYDLSEIHDVLISSPTNNDLLTYSSSASAWINSGNINTLLNSNSSNWSSVYNTVQSNSAINWNYQGTDLKALTSNWQSTYISFQSQSANNALVFTNVNSNSANWNSSYTTVNLNSAIWADPGTGDVNVNSFVYSQSANILDTITTVQDYSALWILSGGSIDNETDPLFTSWAQTFSADYESVYTTVQTNSASWGTGGVPQTLSFNENNAELTISSGNTVSLSSLSGGTSGGSGVSIQGNIAYNRWQFIGAPPISSFNIIGSQSEIEESFRVTVDSVIQDPINYTVSGNFITFSESPLLSSNIVVVETYVVPDESPLVVHQYQRWFHTGNGSTSAFDISGAFLTDRFAYRVTVDYLLQDPLSYNIDLSQGSLLFSESPPLSSEIVIVEQYHTSLTATVSSFTTPVTASGDFLIVRVNNVDRAIRLWDF